jgi:hypothetical protein
LDANTSDVARAALAVPNVGDIVVGLLRRQRDFEAVLDLQALDSRADDLSTIRHQVPDDGLQSVFAQEVDASNETLLDFSLIVRQSLGISRTSFISSSCRTCRALASAASWVSAGMAS